MAYATSKPVARLDAVERNEDFVKAKPLIQVGIAFIFLAIVAVTYRGGDAHREQTVQIWPVQVGVDAMKTLARFPLMIGLVLAGGVGLVALGVRKSS
jgi:hypothetical protein